MRARPRAPSVRAGGYTQLELVIVVVVLVVLTGVTVPTLTSLGRARDDAAAARIRSSLVHAQAWATGRGTYTWVRVRRGPDRLDAFFDPESTAAGGPTTVAFQPNRGRRVPLPDPLTLDDLAFDLGASGFDVVTADFGGGNEVMFDPLGRPHRQDGRAFTQDATIRLAGGPVVRIARTTGLVTVE